MCVTQRAETSPSYLFSHGLFSLSLAFSFAFFASSCPFSPPFHQVIFIHSLQRVSRLDLEIAVSSLRHFSHRLNLQLQREPSCDHTLAQWFSMVLPAACEILSKFFRVGYEKPAETCKRSFVAALPCLPSPWLVLQSRKFTLLFLRNSAPNDPNDLQSQMCLCI